VAITTDPNRFAQGLFSGLPSRYDLLAEVLSLGQNRRWRAASVARVVQDSPGLVLDVATGTAGVALQIAGRSDAHVVGVDLSLDMLGRGAANVAAGPHAARISLVAARAEELPFPDAAFDAVSFSYLLRYVEDPAATLAELARVARPGGTVASLEFCVPPRPWWRVLWVIYTRALLPLAGLLTGGPAWFRVGRFLGPNIAAFYRRHPLPDLSAAWEKAGLVGVHHQLMSLGGGVVSWARRGSG